MPWQRVLEFYREQVEDFGFRLRECLLTRNVAPVFHTDFLKAYKTILSTQEATILGAEEDS